MINDAQDAFAMAESIIADLRVVRDNLMDLNDWVDQVRVMENEIAGEDATLTQRLAAIHAGSGPLDKASKQLLELMETRSGLIHEVLPWSM